MDSFESARAATAPEAGVNFLERIITEDVGAGIYHRPICTRFPPEPNGYLHIGSLYAVNINYSAAKHFNGVFNLRLDDTNPLKEDMEYVNAIIEDMQWAGYDPGENIFYGSDYFQTIYELTLRLIENGLAFVCDLSPDELRESRGTLTAPGVDSPYRGRSAAENLKLFQEMKDGKFAPGEKVLRAKIDMASPNMNMRDPAIYRILNAEHYRAGNAWRIYPMYDYAHPIQDAIEDVTHSMCSLEFKDHRPLYEWVLNALRFAFPEPPKQREFGRMNITGAITGKRYLRQLVNEGYVEGWDDPRLPTVKGLRRRGFTPEAIHHFLNEIGVARDMSTVDISMLEHCLREDLKSKAPTVMAALEPLPVVITNYPEGQTEMMEVENNVENPALGSRKLPFSRHILVEREDFMEVPAKGFHRLYPGNEVRLKGAYFIRCTDVIKNADGSLREIHCTYDPATRSGLNFTERKVKATLHWLEANHTLPARVNFYSRLLTNENISGEEIRWDDYIDPQSKIVLENCQVEESLSSVRPEDKFQFIRHGYFVVDTRWEPGAKLIFNRIVALKDTKNKIKSK
ncbi:MAG: glutamine--tRNA ligase/YqeY domain fusion protein [Clostridiales bacterium]|jgi:glutaminyl-tRNA synthetase|nr:glutamine--tRNA ligase/YqeY domain fusion protein [Clostridiales bacterium]